MDEPFYVTSSSKPTFPIKYPYWNLTFISQVLNNRYYFLEKTAPQSLRKLGEKNLRFFYQNPFESFCRPLVTDTNDNNNNDDNNDINNSNNNHNNKYSAWYSSAAGAPFSKLVFKLVKEIFKQLVLPSRENLRMKSLK